MKKKKRRYKRQSVKASFPSLSPPLLRLKIIQARRIVVEHARYELTSVIRDARQRVFSASLALHQTVYVYIYIYILILHIYSITSPTSRLNPLDCPRTIVTNVNAQISVSTNTSNIQYTEVKSHYIIRLQNV